MASETRTDPGSKVFLQIGISKLSLMGRHLLLQVSHLEFYRVQYSDLSCSWYTTNTCSQEFPHQYDFLQMIAYYTELFETRRKQSHYNQISIIYRNGKEIGRWHLTQTSANISRSPTREMLHRLHITFTDRL